MTIRFDLDAAHPAYRPLIEARMTDLSKRHPSALLERVYVGEPRREGDVSMGYYDEDEHYVWLNGYWFSKDPDILRRAARSEPLFHGRMTEEPAHVLTHEFGHALEWGNRRIRPRMREVWDAATRDPHRAPAAYGLTNDAEYFAELFATCELGLANEDHRAQLRYVMEG